MSLADSIALTTLANARDELGLVDSASDVRLQRMILTASAAIAENLNRELRKESTTEKVRPNDAQKIVLKKTPIVSITTITIDGAELASSGYEVDDADAGTLWRDGGWPAMSLLVEGAAGGDVVPNSDKKRISVTYVAGYVLPNDTVGTRNLPYDLEQACLLTVVSLFRARGQDRRIASEALGDASVAYRQINPAIGLGEGGIIPDEAMPLLAPHRRVVFAP